MPDDPVERGTELLASLVSEIQNGRPIQPDMLSRVREALDVKDVGRSYALVTQPLCKVLEPSVDIRNLTGWSFSPRTTVCKAVVVPFNESLGRPLRASEDPYVSNPLRSGVLGSEDWKAQRRPSDLSAWSPTLALLNDVEAASDPFAAAYDLLAAVVARLLELVVTPSSMIREMLAIQAEIRAGVDAYERRRDLLVGRATRAMEKLAEVAGHDLSVEASTGLGTPAEVPWLRLYNAEHSPSATTGEYLVYLFAADGSAAYLSLIVGTEGAGLEGIDARVAALRSELGESHTDLLTEVDLRSTQAGGRPRAYEHGSIYAKRYPVDEIPNDEDLTADLSLFATMLSTLEASSPEDPGGLLHRLTLEAVRDALGDLVVPDSLLLDAIAALRAGKHLLLTGPPGTGKTTLGQALADAARAAGICEGWTTVTAVATWTTYDTVGGYQQDLDGSLRFSAGAALRAIDANEWLVIDELNRADIDKALGSLFTVLSGQVVELTLYETLSDGSQVPVTIAPAASPSLGDESRHTVHPGWRLIATMNTWDQDLLFTMSYALLRRFAVIHVNPPPSEELVALLGEVEPIEDEDLATSVASLAALPHLRLGPAILRTTARFVRERHAVALPHESADALLMSALASEVVPQLSHLSPEELADVVSYLSQEVLRSTPPEEVRVYLESQVGMTIPATALASPPGGGFKMSSESLE